MLHPTNKNKDYIKENLGYVKHNGIKWNYFASQKILKKKITKIGILQMHLWLL